MFQNWKVQENDSLYPAWQVSKSTPVQASIFVHSECYILTLLIIAVSVKAISPPQAEGEHLNGPCIDQTGKAKDFSNLSSVS